MDRFFRSTVEAPTAAHAERRLRERYGDVALSGVGGYRERSAGDPRFAVSKVALEGEFSIQADVRVVTIGFSTPGYRWRSGEESGDLSNAPALFEPGKLMGSRLTGRTGVTTVTLDLPALEDFAEGYYGRRTRIDYEGSRPASPKYSRLWAETVSTVIQTAALDNDMSRAAAYQALAIMALEAFRLRGDTESRSTTARGSVAAYRRATEFVDANLDVPVTEADIARAAGVSLAELRSVYAAHSVAGWTPAQHLRSGRLASVHVDLLRGDPARDTVTSIAGRWGFTNPSKFAEAYRSMFGFSPRTVLGR